MNLIEAIFSELERNTELLEAYREIPTGGFAIAAIKQKIEAAKKAIASNDVDEMTKAYAALKESE